MSISILFQKIEQLKAIDPSFKLNQFNEFIANHATDEEKIQFNITLESIKSSRPLLFSIHNDNSNYYDNLIESLLLNEKLDLTYILNITNLQRLHKCSGRMKLSLYLFDKFDQLVVNSDFKLDNYPLLIKWLDQFCPNLLKKITIKKGVFSEFSLFEKSKQSGEMFDFGFTTELWNNSSQRSIIQNTINSSKYKPNNQTVTLKTLLNFYNSPEESSPNVLINWLNRDFFYKNYSFTNNSKLFNLTDMSRSIGDSQNDSFHINTTIRDIIYQRLMNLDPIYQLETIKGINKEFNNEYKKEQTQQLVDHYIYNITVKYIRNNVLTKEVIESINPILLNYFFDKELFSTFRMSENDDLFDRFQKKLKELLPLFFTDERIEQLKGFLSLTNAKTNEKSMIDFINYELSNQISFSNENQKTELDIAF